ncbi:MAG TPA: metallopeptidase family protein [Mycobacteriales bacterium]|jgi:predicted Zn-dependent protease with MMP-like domain|nr:metallopeptidase family protein [Mycobacteriales bacterium]
MDRPQFEELVAQALDEIPTELARQMNNVVVVVEEESAAGNLLGLYEGYALTERGWDYGSAAPLPDQITVYRQPILRMCDTEGQVAEQIRITVVHEVAHHFGIDDDRLHELGWD